MGRILYRLCLMAFFVINTSKDIEAKDVHSLEVLTISLEKYIVGNISYEELDRDFVVTSDELIKMVKKENKDSQSRERTINMIKTHEYHKHFCALCPDKFVAFKQIMNIKKEELPKQSKTSISAYKIVYSGININDTVSELTVFVSGSEKDGFRILASTQYNIK